MSRVRREQRHIVKLMVEVARHSEDRCDNIIKYGTCAILGGNFLGV